MAEKKTPEKNANNACRTTRNRRHACTEIAYLALRVYMHVSSTIKRIINNTGMLCTFQHVGPTNICVYIYIYILISNQTFFFRD